MLVRLSEDFKLFKEAVPDCRPECLKKCYCKAYAQAVFVLITPSRRRKERSSFLYTSKLAFSFRNFFRRAVLEFTGVGREQPSTHALRCVDGQAVFKASPRVQNGRARSS